MVAVPRPVNDSGVMSGTGLNPRELYQRNEKLILLITMTSNFRENQTVSTLSKMQKTARFPGW